ncbi:hypothetical protein M1446_05345 [Candidatus Dependentiae bacterium]|nr:hypothetical protein [Candidatus Dependentiae bacterium]
MNRFFLILFALLTLNNLQGMENDRILKTSNKPKHSQLFPEIEQFNYNSFSNEDFQYLLNFAYFTYLYLSRCLQLKEIFVNIKEGNWPTIEIQALLAPSHQKFLYIQNIYEYVNSYQLRCSENVTRFINLNKQKLDKIGDSDLDILDKIKEQIIFYKFVCLELFNQIHKKNISVKYQTIMFNTTGIIEESKRLIAVPTIH